MTQASQAQVAAQLTSDAVLYALGGSLAFLFAVVLLDPLLRKSAIGKSLIIVDAGLSALYIPAVLHRFTGINVTEQWFAFYYLATILMVGTGVWWRTLIMVAAQVRKRRRNVTTTNQRRPL